MSRIIPIPTSRVGDLFIRQRLVDQVQFDQLALFQLQTQVSTGMRLQLPSDDAPAALRAINLQRLLDRKGQIRTNLQASNSYLSAAGDRLSSVSTLLSDLRGAVVGVSDTVTPQSARDAVMQQVDSVLRELVSAGNAKYQGRYLFAGSRSQVQPYGLSGDFVEYFGNEGALRSYVDLEQLFETNLAGTDVFGGVSAGVQGSADLNPNVTENTLVSTLNGGNGIGANPAITISYTSGSTTTKSVVDLSTAVTVGDVARLIEAGAPAASGVAVNITDTGLTLQSLSGTISVSEVAQGRTARQLGVLSDPNLPPAGTIVGGDVNPALLKTTRLADLGITLDTASGLIVTNGGQPVTLDISGAETVEDLLNVFNAAGMGLTADINATKTGINVRSRLSGADLTIGENGGNTATQLGIRTYTGATELAALNRGAGVATTSALETLDTAQLDEITITARDGAEFTVDLSAAESLQEVIDAINGAPENTGTTSVQARLTQNGNGIELVDSSTPINGSLRVAASQAAEYLGFVSPGATDHSSATTDVDGNYLLSGANVLGHDMVIVASDGTELWIDLAETTTVQDVIDRINSNPNAGASGVTARLALVGNGIELVNASGGTDPLTVRSVQGSLAAEQLGFVPAGQTEVSIDTPDAGGDYVLKSEDRHTLEVDSVFNTLARLRTALETGDLAEIGRSLERLDADMDRVNFARAELGARLQSLDTIDVRLQDEDVQLRSALSQDLDVDLVKAISDLTARQYAFEASLRTTASLMQMTLLNFL